MTIGFTRRGAFGLLHGTTAGVSEIGDVGVAAAVLFLASDGARWITGVVLPVDGGYTGR